MVLASTSILLLVLWVLLACLKIPLPLNLPFFAWLQRQWLLDGLVVLVCLGVVSFLLSERRRPIIQQIPWWPAWWAWLAWTMVGVIYSIDRGLTIRSGLAFASYGLLAFLMFQLARSPETLMAWVRFLVWVALIAGLEGFFQYFRTFSEALKVMERLEHAGALATSGWGPDVIRDFLSRKRIFSIFGWPNLFAGFLLLTIPLTLGVSRLAPTRRRRLIWLAAAGLLAVCLVLTLSLGGWIAAVLTGAVTWALWKRARDPQPAQRDGASGMMMRVILLGVLISGLMLTTSFIVAKRARPFISASSASRLVYVEGGWNAWRAHPLLGTGLGTFGLAYRAFMPLEQAEGQHAAIHAHNTLVQLAAELGLVGLALFLVLLRQVARMALRVPLGQGEARVQVLRWSLGIGLLGFFLHSLLEQTFFEAVTAPFWWIVLGLFTAASSLLRAKTARSEQATGRFMSWSLPLMTAVASLALAVPITAADLWAGRGAFADLSGHPQEAAHAFAQAQRLNPLESRFALEQAERTLDWGAHQPAATDAQRRKVLTDSLRFFERTVILSPWLGYGWMRLGMIHWQLGDTVQALEAMRHAAQRDPNSREAHRQLAAFLSATQQWDELCGAARQLQQLEPRNAQGWFYEAAAWQMLNQLPQAVACYRDLVQRLPALYPGWFNLAQLLDRLGDVGGAAEAYRRFLDVAPETERAARTNAQAFLNTVSRQ